MSKIGRGEDVWIKRTVRSIDVGPDGAAYRCVGVSTWDVEVLPDSPALPAVARWLAEPRNWNAAAELGGALDLLAGEIPAPCLDRMRSLVAALGGQGDGGGQ